MMWWLYQGPEFEALLTDLLKAFDCLAHSSLIAKYSTHGFNMKELCFTNEYLRYCKQSTKISDTYSSREEILYEVSQRSKLGPLLFNIDLYGLFVIIDQHGISNYADNNTHYVPEKI